MRCIIAGSRGITSQAVVETAIRASGWRDKITVVVSGTARGVDAEGEAWADRNARDVVRYPADWEMHGRAAGLIRNREMAKNADALIAVWDGESRGTKNMIYEARERGLEVYVYRVSAEVKP